MPHAYHLQEPITKHHFLACLGCSTPTTVDFVFGAAWNNGQVSCIGKWTWRQNKITFNRAEQRSLIKSAVFNTNKSKKHHLVQWFFNDGTRGQGSHTRNSKNP